MRKITVAENAGFCFGVKRATDRLEQALREARPGERIFTLGHLIHNETYNESLRRRGVESIDDVDTVEALAKTANEANPMTVLVRAHGCTVPCRREPQLPLAGLHLSLRQKDSSHRQGA